MKGLWMIVRPWIPVLLVVALTACAPASAPGSAGEVIENGEAQPAVAGEVQYTPGCEPIPERTEDFSLDQEKPTLPLFNLYNYEKNQYAVTQVIGFVLPDGFIALRAAALNQITDLHDPNASNNIAQGIDMRAVGTVEIGEELSYIVALNLLETAGDNATEVAGELIPLDGNPGIPVSFLASPVQLNPEPMLQEATRQEINVSIEADSVCFVIPALDGKGFWRYCSADEQLSVQARYDDAYSGLQQEMTQLAEQLGLTIDVEQVISEMEDIGNLEACQNDANRCSADIVGAPVTGFMEEYAAKLDQCGDGSFGIDAGVVQVLQPIESANTLPGRYKVQFWYEAKRFVGATITGETAEGAPVENQWIPAFSASFVGPDEPLSQISAWRLGRWCCWWQRSCP
ncbi:MAG: hypothetical protein R3E79_26355 [Caldilineaceae bacterium]